MKEPDDRSRRSLLKASSMLGLAVAFRPATIGEAFADSQSNTAQKENTMAQTSATQAAKLNALPQFITEIDGLDIHFIHVRSKHENALPLIVTHG